MTTVSEFSVTSEGRQEDLWFLGTLATVKASTATTGGQLALVEFVHPAGFATPRHVHHAEDEGFYVLEGSMVGFCGERRWRAEKGAFVWLPRGVPHGYRVDGQETLRTLAITVPAGFEQFVRELAEPAPGHDLPTEAVVPDPERILAAAADHGQEILGPYDRSEV